MDVQVSTSAQVPKHLTIIEPPEPNLVRRFWRFNGSLIKKLDDYGRFRLVALIAWTCFYYNFNKAAKEVRIKEYYDDDQEKQIVATAGLIFSIIGQPLIILFRATGFVFKTILKIIKFVFLGFGDSGGDPGAGG